MSENSKNLEELEVAVECCGRLKIDQYLRFVPTQN